MPNTKKHFILFIALLVALVLLFFVNISLGSVTIPNEEILKGIFSQKMNKESWEIILYNFRLPKAFTAILVGMALSISGLLMQTLFRNPLAGPYVLGLSSGASLGVAFVILGTGILPSFLSNLFLTSYGIVVASGLGSALVLMAVLLVSKKLKDTMAILIVGLMFGSFTSAIVSVLTYFSTAEQLQKFTFWSLGSLANLSWNEVSLLAILTFTGLGISFLVIKPLDALLLGERYANSLGINFKKTRILIIIATSILAGSITAFVGPIAFIGLAVPHMAKLLFQTSNHLTLFWSTILLGAIILLFCDIIAQLPGSDLTLPINAITSMIGAPIVIWLLVRKKNFS
ncbi:iron ABC transporter permease [uncultured Flavobacterium sp.]|uniref:iron ABC transporter permease n=1 Tax=uncultured Flavobacterium sp. TaxID=165435 RepID=UPI0030EF1004